MGALVDQLTERDQEPMIEAEPDEASTPPGPSPKRKPEKEVRIMAALHSTKDSLIPAAAYIRMSGRQQDKSPAEQRAEITKLAAREGLPGRRVVHRRGNHRRQLAPTTGPDWPPC